MKNRLSADTGTKKVGTCVLGKCHLSSGDGVHLDYVVSVKLSVSVALVQQGGANPVGITFDSLHLPEEGWLSCLKIVKIYKI